MTSLSSCSSGTPKPARSATQVSSLPEFSTKSERPKVHDRVRLTRAPPPLVTWQPLDEKTSFGPLISSQQRDKVLSYVESGVSEGATLATGGKKWGNEGFFIEPTVLSNCKPSFKCVREEVSQPPRGCHTENRVELTLFFLLFGAPLPDLRSGGFDHQVFDRGRGARTRK